MSTTGSTSRHPRHLIYVNNASWTEKEARRVLRAQIIRRQRTVRHRVYISNNKTKQLATPVVVVLWIIVIIACWLFFRLKNHRAFVTGRSINGKGRTNWKPRFWTLALEKFGGDLLRGWLQCFGHGQRNLSTPAISIQLIQASLTDTLVDAHPLVLLRSQLHAA